MEAIYLIRHEKTVANQQGRFCGQSETDLLLDAEKNLEKLKVFFCEIPLNCVFSSPMIRAQKTAEVIHKHVIIQPGLSEIDFGLFEGHTFQEIQDLYPKEAQEILEISNFHEYSSYRYPEGESLQIFYNRCITTFQEISFSIKSGTSIAIVAHSGTIRAILSFVLSGKSDLFWKMKIDNGSVSKINRMEDFYMMEYINRIP